MQDEFTSLVRNALKKVLGFYYGLNPRVQRAVDTGLTVFTFHDVTNRPSKFARRYGLYVSTATFEKQVRWIQKNFELISPTAILADEPIPKRAAIISFDDGFRGTFDNGLRILGQLGAPSVVFLNMAPILHGTPLLSASACFLDDVHSDFSNFCINSGLARPFHLTLNPTIWAAYQRQYELVDMKAVLEFQGEFADLEMISSWDGHPLVCFGNHLFEHWNAVALSVDEFKKQYQDNENALNVLTSKVNLFAFTNGRPNICFTRRELALLKAAGVGKAFSTAGGVNQNKESFLQGRVALCESDSDPARLWFRVGWALQQDRLLAQKTWIHDDANSKNDDEK